MGNNELTRLKNFVSLAEVLLKAETSGVTLKPEADTILNNMYAVLTNIWKPFTSEQESTFADMRKKMKEVMTGLGVSEVERQQVVSAMGMGKGHWYACSWGYVYAIGECGGATQMAKCPECGLSIGGTQHRLTEGNRGAA